MLRASSDEPKDVLPENPVKTWRRKVDANLLVPDDLISFFQAASPHFFDIENYRKVDLPESLGKCSFDIRSAQSFIIDSIEELMCGDNPELVFNKLKSEDNYPSVCGRVFKVGEPTYSCRECGLDPTCVLCVNCFKQSAHRYHKYKISTSNGGGCCDCGDTEAWKKDPYCEEHILGIEKKTETTSLTEHMRKCCYLVFQAIMLYCTKSLVIDTNFPLVGYNVDDVFCTVLYNDESHTFEQVITTLTRIVGCHHKDAVEYVTSIDREGRAVVKCSTFEDAMKLKQEIETHGTRASNPRIGQTALTVKVLHKNNVAQQQFALQLLGWFQELLTKHIEFRKIFCEVVTEDKNYNIEHILSYDCKLWKTARASWHRLLISGMLMEYENKKILAITFTKLYANLMQDYIHDDHEHSYSVVSLSVQLFTVPTIAHHLISHESAFFKLMHTFYSDCIEKYVQKKVLQFSKNTANLNIFKRASFILFDVKYLLNYKPEVWTDELRRGFLHGIQILLKLLNVMQGMDAAYRQTGQHMEYEPEWESAFNLHVKLANLITLALDWCSSDKVVLVKVYRMILATLMESDFIISQASTEVRELADHSTSCYMYDVLVRPVSVHLPLSRFFAGLYLHLERYGLSFDNIVTNSTKPTPEQIIEPVLCTQTMIAQVNSGLWRRNGYSILNQLHFYRNVRCRAEMLDRDITLLQIGASLIESNEFMIHIINKFNLVDWANPDFERDIPNEEQDDTILRVNYMVDEFLELLIVVVGERYIPGVGKVTEEDKIKKEIIQQLCIKPFAHSELNRTLADVHQDIGIEGVISSVAEFKKPTQSDRIGYYALKDEFYDDYNMYFYHYSKEDKSISEEAQRKRKKDKNEKVCCPPPKLPQLSESFHMIANLLQCDVMLLVMQTVLKRSIDLKARCFAESHLQKVLHLIGYAIHEQMSNYYPFLTFHERAAKWNLLSLIEELVSSPRVEPHRDFILWTIQKYKEMQAATSDVKLVENVEEENQVPSSAVTEQLEREKRAQRAAERRAKILAQIQKDQNKFLSHHADLIESSKSTIAVIDDDIAKTTAEMEWQSNETSIACLGPNKKCQSMPSDRVPITCILCSEESIVTKDSPCMVYCAFVQKSSVLSRYQKTNENGQLLYLETAIHPSPHTSTCGHLMHATCWQEYFNNELLKETRRPARNRSPSGFDIEKKEFLCPLCRCISNAVLPLTPELRRLASMPLAPPTDEGGSQCLTFERWMDAMNVYVKEANLNSLTNMFPGILEEISGKMDITSEEFYKLSPSCEEQIGKELSDHISLFMESVRRITPYPASVQSIEPFLVTWLSCAYTIESLEMLLRANNKPIKDSFSIRHTACLSGLVRLCSLMGVSIKEVDKYIIMNLGYHMCDLYETVFFKKGMSVLSWDVFGMLISLLYITPCTIYSCANKMSIPKGDMLEYYILKLMFLANMARIVIVYERPVTDMEVEGDVEPIEDVDANKIDSKLLEFFREYNIYDENSSKVTTEVLVEAIKKQSETFLRCSCLLFYFMTDIELPDEFAYLGGDTFELMCGYLGLTANIESYFENEKMLEFMKTLVSHNDIISFKKDIKNISKEMIVPVMSSVPPIRQLVTLPDDYSDLINSVSCFTCPNYDRDDSRNPTMCLVCGEILCSQTYCCQKELDSTMVGACTYHAHTCGAGVGMFLRIRECEILLLGINKGSFVLPPYLDEYGETDQGLRRGNPLHLCKERYKKLHLMWLGHNLHEEIARSIETQNIIPVTQWHHL